MSENGNVRLELRWQVQTNNTVMMNMAPIFLRNSLQLGTFANSAALRTAFIAMVLLFPKLWSESDCVSWKWNMRR